VDFVLHDGDFATSSLERWAYGHRAETVQVQAITLDCVCVDWPRLDLVKIDAVSERSKPASHGRLKTSHFEERQMESLTSWVHPAPREVGDGESAQSGHGRDDSFAA
jgi:hypothetical protein